MYNVIQIIEGTMIKVSNMVNKWFFENNTTNLMMDELCKDLIVTDDEL